MFPEEVHLTVATLRYQNIHQRNGICSTYLSDRTGVEDTVRIFVEKNPDFRLPKDLNASVIMVGPGTGLAPFRAFLQEREYISDQRKKLAVFWKSTFHHRLPLSNRVAKLETEKNSDKPSCCLFPGF